MEAGQSGLSFVRQGRLGGLFVLFVPGFSPRSFESRRCLRFSTLIVVFQFRVPLFGLAIALWGFCSGVGLGYSRVS